MTPNVGIVHLGLGAFWRAFGLPWIEDAMRQEAGDWAVLGVSLRSPVVRDALKQMRNRYHVLEKGAGEENLRKVSALKGVLVAPEDPAAVVSAMADARIKLVTLTVTEKGYHLNSATGGLDVSHPDIQHDLENLEDPKTTIGFIVAALAKRRTAGVAPFTCISCDNLPNNGHALQCAVVDFAQLFDPELASWIELNCAFPSTMIDRIVPATTMADIAEVERMTGEVDEGAVISEKFRQWVIENKFCGPRPAFEKAGAILTDDVSAYEKMKLRCLNGTHSAIAYIGVVAGIKTVSDAMENDVIRGYVKNLWRDEIVPSFQAPPGVAIEKYTQDLMARYCNPSIQHKTLQIAMDGSKKLPQRILDTMANNLTQGHQITGLAHVVAAWIRHLQENDEQGNQFAINDPMADELRLAVQSSDPVGSVLGIKSIFAKELAGEPRFKDEVQSAFLAITKTGVIERLRELK